MCMLGSISMVAAGQGVVKEVAGIRDFAPEKRKASRMEAIPTMLTIRNGNARPSFNSEPVTVDIEPTIATFKLLPDDYIYLRPDKRGYAALGYFPKGDIDLSAGYRLLDTRTMTARVWTQLDRNYYHGQFKDRDEKYRTTTTDLAVGANYAWKADEHGVLAASVTYMYDHFNYPIWDVEPLAQSVNRFRVDAKWDGRAGDSFTYGAQAGLLRFGNSDAIIPEGYTVTGNEASPLGETVWKAGAYGKLQCSRKVSVGLRINYEEASLNRIYIEEAENALSMTSGVGKGVLSITPDVGFTGSKMTGRLGLNFAIATRDVSGTSIGTEAAWNWLVSDYFSINADVAAGPVLNTLEQMYHVNRYASPLSTPGISYIPFDFKLSLNLLSYKGFTLTAGGDFSWANDWVLPALVDKMAALEIDDIHTGIYFLKGSYRYGDTFDMEASVTGAAGNSCSKTYYKWNDRATTVVNAGINWHPVKNVTLSASYDLRTGRKVIYYQSGGDIGFESLGNISDLALRAHWQLNDMIGVYGLVEGITQGKYLHVSGLPGQRLKPLVGLTMRF